MPRDLVLDNMVQEKPLRLSRPAKTQAFGFELLLDLYNCKKAPVTTWRCATGSSTNVSPTSAWKTGSAEYFFYRCKPFPR